MYYDKKTETEDEDEEDTRNFVEEEAEAVVYEEAADNANMENKLHLEYSKRLIQVESRHVDLDEKQ